MKALIAIALSFAVIGCASNGSGTYRYCSVAGVETPQWYNELKGQHIVNRFGVRHNRKAERDVLRTAQLQLAQQLYSRVSGSTTLVNGRLEESSQYSMVASNLYLDSAKVDWTVQNGCMIVWAGVTMDAARRSLQASHAINEQEREDWADIHNTYSITLLKRHIEQYPLGIYRKKAEERIASLEQDQFRESVRDSRLPAGAKLILNAFSSVF